MLNNIVNVLSRAYKLYEQITSRAASAGASAGVISAGVSAGAWKCYVFLLCKMRSTSVGLEKQFKLHRTIFCRRDYGMIYKHTKFG